jgi:hypothetical protein
VKLSVGLNRDAIEVDLDRLPATVERSGSRFLGGFLILFALAWGGIPVVGLLGTKQQFEPIEAAVLVIFTLAAIAIALFGLNEIVRRKVITFEGSRISVVQRGLRGTRSWRQPLSAYRGVKAHTRRVRRNKRSYTLYLVDLLHPEAERTVNLYTAASKRDWREKWEHYARRLNMPALEEGEDGLIERAAGDLDKSAADLVREGKIEIDHGALGTKAEGLGADIVGDSLVITRAGSRNHPLGWAFMVLFSGIFLYFGFVFEDTPGPVRWPVGGIGLFFAVGLVTGAIWDIVSRERLRVSSSEVRILSITRWGETRGRAIPASGVEGVKVVREPGQWRKSVVIGSDERALTFGQGLAEESLAFVRNSVLAKLVEGATDAGEPGGPRPGGGEMPRGRRARALLDS